MRFFLTEGGKRDLEDIYNCRLIYQAVAGRSSST